MISVSIHDAKTHLSALIAGIERSGERVIIKRHGRAVAELMPISRKSRLSVDPVLRKVTIHGDLTEPTAGEWEDV